MKTLTIRLSFLALLLVLIAWEPLTSWAQSQRYQRVMVVPDRDIQTTLNGEFTIAAVGDVVAIRPTSKLEVPAVQAVYSILREADVSFGNLEQNIAEPAKVLAENDAHIFQALARPAIADDLRAIGFDLMNFANNHTTHFGIAGLRETMNHMKRVGIVTAGWGRNLAEAQRAKFLDTPKGRIGFLGITTNSFRDARHAGEDSPGYAGANALHVQRTVTIAQEALDALRKAKEISPQLFPGLYPITSARTFRDEGDRIRLYDEYYVAGDHAHYSYSIRSGELATYAGEVRSAKYLSDFVVANIHSHHWQVPDNATSASTETREPPDFLVELAHAAIDNGADAFYSHGEGELRGIEIYKGKPIFYQLGNFTRQPFFQEIFNPEYRSMSRRFPAGGRGPRGRGPRAGGGPPAGGRGAGGGPPAGGPGAGGENLTRAEVQGMIYPVNHGREYFESVVAVSHYDEGALKQIRLHPVDLKFDGPFVDIGTPHLATGELAQRVLETIREASEPFGTEVRIAGDVGIIEIN